MSKIIDFYRGTAPDGEGRTLEEIWAWDDEELEDVHDYIQWLFPLPEASNFNPDAPLLTRADVAVFAADESLRQRLLTSFDRFLAFAGLHRGTDGRIADGSDLPLREPIVWRYFNHNWLRVTRVLRSLTLLGLAEQARAFHAWLESAYQRQRYPIPERTMRFWSDAIEKRDA